MDTSEYVRFQQPGHRVTGDRSSQDRQHRDGIDFAHAIVDDHTRLAYAEIHPDQKATTVAGFLERALVFYASHVSGTQNHPSCCSGVFMDESAESVAAVELVWWA
jgi:hypothetical protein